MKEAGRPRLTTTEKSENCLHISQIASDRALDGPKEPASGSGCGSTHAWAQIYLPSIGWIDFDPTSGSIGNIGLVRVAVVRDPRHALPLHGTFIGVPSDHLGMEVRVSLWTGLPEAIWVAPQRSTRPQYRQLAPDKLLESIDTG